MGTLLAQYGCELSPSAQVAFFAAPPKHAYALPRAVLSLSFPVRSRVVENVIGAHETQKVAMMSSTNVEDPQPQPGPEVPPHRYTRRDILTLG